MMFCSFLADFTILDCLSAYFQKSKEAQTVIICF